MGRGGSGGSGSPSDSISVSTVVEYPLRRLSISALKRIFSSRSLCNSWKRLLCFPERIFQLPRSGVIEIKKLATKSPTANVATNGMNRFIIPEYCILYHLLWSDANLQIDRIVPALNIIAFLECGRQIFNGTKMPVALFMIRVRLKTFALGLSTFIYIKIRNKNDRFYIRQNTGKIG